MIEPKDNLSSGQSFAPPPPPWRQNVYNRPAMPTPPMPPMGGNFSGGSLPGVGDLLSQAWSIFVSNAGTYIGIAILPIVIQIIGMVVLFFVLLGGLFIGGLQSLASPFSMVSKVTSASSLLLLIAVGLVIAAVHILSQAALIYTAVHREKRTGLGEAFGFALGKLFSFLWVAILSIIIIGGGSFLFIIPGILFAIWFILAPFVLMGEDARGMTALLRSREYVRGNGLAVFWRIFAFGLIVGLAFFAVYLGISIIGGIILAMIKSSMVKLIAGLIFFFVPFIIQPIVAALNAIYTALIYEHLRAARPAPSFAPSIAQKAIFLGIGILGLALPVFGLAGAVGSLFSYKDTTQNGLNFGNIVTMAVQAKQRDTRRLIDIKGIQNGLELYFVDHNGYPAVASPVVLASDKAMRLEASGWTNSSSTGNPVYMIKVPANPAPGGADYVYVSTDASGAPCTQGPSCAAYTITFKLESGVGGYKSGDLVATPPDVISEKNNSINSLKDYQYNTNANSISNTNGGNQNSNSSLFQDTDKDGLSDSIEKSLGTNSNIADTDFDGLSDGDEVNIWKTKPTNPDTDGDGFRDGDEAKNGYNPLGNGKTENN